MYFIASSCSAWSPLRQTRSDEIDSSGGLFSAGPPGIRAERHIDGHLALATQQVPEEPSRFSDHAVARRLGHGDDPAERGRPTDQPVAVARDTPAELSVL